MVSDHQEHREQTLMFSDIVGYSRLMGRDEALTIEMLGDYRKILLAHIAEHDGVFIEFAGDAIFSRFNSSLSAVNAAVAIQKHLQLFNQGRDKELPKLQTRIGIHKGLVLLRENAVLGDDVNIAARLEPLAVADGICISKAIYDDIKIDVREPIKALGPQSLKNIQHKIRAYLIKPSGIKTRDHFHYFWLGCSKTINAYRYPISAAVLAIFIAGFYFIPRWLVPGYAANYVEIANFQNLMNADGKSDYFSAGITEAVRSQLADMRDVYLVDADKGIHAPIRLEGSVQKVGDNLRIAYRIFRREGNVQIAGGKLDGAYQDIFILQDRLVGDIARNLATEFNLQNFRPAPLKLTNDITAYDYYLQGMDYLSKPSSQENFDQAIQRFNEALVHDNQFNLAYSGLCEAFRLNYELIKSINLIKKAEEYCITALKQNNKSPKALQSMGAVYRDLGKYNKAVSYLETAKSIDQDNIVTSIDLARTYILMQNDAAAEALYKATIQKAPKDWRSYHAYGYFLMGKGRYLEAIQNYKKTLDITPENFSAFNNIGAANGYIGNFTEAAKAFEKSVAITPSSWSCSNLGDTYYFLGDYLKAANMYQEALRLEPDNYITMLNLAAVFLLLPDKKHLSEDLFNKVLVLAGQDTEMNPNNVIGYLYSALAFANLQNVTEAKKMLMLADAIENSSSESYYTHLKIAVVNRDNDDIRRYAKALIATGYSEKTLRADPSFLVLKEKQFKDVFKKQ
ncbi:MAG: adenylate/guanylate cyclase domain-containing protein [Gammaproteobacteria bacterium]|nr:MAG: adenylate/guanylate cyclase domain-containing protein [Gammaproteobacteria bacterium]